MKLIIIAAIAENRVIGKDGKIPWHISEDIQRFKQLTLHHPVIMGRKTWESLPDKFRPLPDRWNIVLTRQETYQETPQAAGAQLFPSLEQALAYIRETKQGYIREAEQWSRRATEQGSRKLEGIKFDYTYVIGGQQVYEQALPLAQKMEITEVHFPYKGDAHFPDFNREEWRESARVKRGQYSFVSYVRK